MANSFSASFETIWAKVMQEQFYKTNVSRMIADFSFNSEMSSGDTLKRVYRSSNRPYAYVRGTDISVDSKTDTAESLSVNKQYANVISVDDFDNIQSKYDIAAGYGKDNAEYLSNQVDADVLGEVLNATNTVDDGDLGGVSGNGIALTTANILSVFATGRKKLFKQNVSSRELFAVISPDFEAVLIQYGATRVTEMGDKLNENGYIVDFYGMKLYRSNQLTASAYLALATAPTNGDTITIAGQTFTFVTTIGSTAGNVLIGANVAASRTNLAALLSAPGTTTSTGVALTTGSDNLKNFLANVTAAVSGSGVQVYMKGISNIAVSETLTDATDTWTATKIIQHQLFGVKGNPVCVMQREPSVKVAEIPLQFGKYYKNGVLYGVKTFADNAKKMVNVKIKDNF